MATTFVWKGRTPAGEVLSGELQADDKQELINQLRKRRILITSVQPKSMGSKEIRLRPPRVTVRELGIFTRQFATMINAGLPLVQCLNILGDQQPNPTFKAIIREVKADIEQGSTFADALAKHEKPFDALFVNLVAAGEVGGILDTIMNRMANLHDSTYRTSDCRRGT